MIFSSWTAKVLKLLKEIAVEMIPKYGKTEHKVGLRVAERKMIFEIALTFN